MCMSMDRNEDKVVVSAWRFLRDGVEVLLVVTVLTVIL